MPNEPVWLSTEKVLGFNRVLVALSGESFGVVHPGSLESAVARPRNHWSYGEEDLAVLAADLCLSIARSHPFVQRNKRTGFVALDMSLYRNGWRFVLIDADEAAQAPVDVLTRDRPERSFVEMVATNVELLDA